MLRSMKATALTFFLLISYYVGPSSNQLEVFSKIQYLVGKKRCIINEQRLNLYKSF